MKEDLPRTTPVTAYVTPNGTVSYSEEPLAGQMRVFEGPLGKVEMVVKGSTDTGDVIGPVKRSPNLVQSYISIQIWLERTSEIYAAETDIKWFKNEARNSELRIAAANAIQKVKLKKVLQ